MSATYDFSPVDRMKSWLLAVDAPKFDAAYAARHEDDLWFANSGGNVIPDDAGELVVLAGTPASVFLNGYVGNARIEPPDLSYSANDWLRLPEWPLNFAPFIIANFWDSVRVELGESIRTNRRWGASATGKMREMELRRAHDCNTSKGISVYRDFADLIERLRARINSGVDSREITQLDVNGTWHVDAASAILFMQGKGACAVSPVNLSTLPAPKEKASTAEPTSTAATHVYRLPARRGNILTPTIQAAQLACSDAQDPNQVWAELQKMAAGKTQPLLGVTEEGIQYLDTNAEAKFLSRGALKKRMKRQATNHH